MPVNLNPTPVNLPAAVAIPADGELVNSASVAPYVQTAINGIAWLRSVLTGGTSQVIDLLNGLHGTFATFSGNVSVNGGQLFAAEARLCPRVTYGDVSAGVHEYDSPYHGIVVTDPAGAPVAPGCIWKIPGTDFENSEIIFSTLDTFNTINIQDNLGNLLATIINTPGNIREVHCYFRSGAWRLLRPVYR